MPDDHLIAEMSEPDEMELVVATHEAGHSFVAIALGLALDRVQVCDDDPRFVFATSPGPAQLSACGNGLGGGAVGSFSVNVGLSSRFPFSQ